MDMDASQSLISSNLINNSEYIIPPIEPSNRFDIDDISGKIFIGGLSWATTEQNLRYYFEKYGELTDVALMIDKKSGKPRGFGFIKLKDPSAADAVMSTDHTIDGRLVDVKRALPRDKAPGPSRSEACKIFVGGLAPEITEKEFGDYFSAFGIVKDAVVMVDRNTGLSRGFGFVTFEKEDTVDLIMKQEHEIMGKYIETKRAEPRGFYDEQGMYHGMHGMPGNMPGSINYSGGNGGRFNPMGGRGGGRFNPNNMGGRGSPGMMTDGYGGGNYGGGQGAYDGRLNNSGPVGYNSGYPRSVMPPAMNYGGYPSSPVDMGYYGATTSTAPGYPGGYGNNNPGYPGATNVYGGGASVPGNRIGMEIGEYGTDYRQSAVYDSSAVAGYNNAAIQQQMRPQYGGGYSGISPQNGSTNVGSRMNYNQDIPSNGFIGTDSQTYRGQNSNQQQQVRGERTTNYRPGY